MFKLSLFLILTALGAVAGETTVLPDVPKDGFPGVVLMELFTSEGCSSCPKVEEAYNKILAEAQSKGLAVHLVSWHVDIWDKLKTKHGVWKDPYSSPQATARLRSYSAMLPGKLKGRLITPWCIINGRPANRPKGTTLADWFAAKLAKAPGCTITATIDSTTAAEVAVSYAIAGEPAANSHLVALVIQDGITQEITKGENAGKTLQHEGVMRTVATADLASGTEGKLTLARPEGIDAKQLAVMLIVQDKAALIHGVARLPLVAPTAK